MNYTPIQLIAEPRHYRELGYMLIGFIVTECAAFGVAMMARYIYVHYLYSLSP